MQNSSLQLLEDLIAAEAPTGHEAPAVKTWLDFLKPYADEQFTDAYGNGFAVFNPKGDPTVMIAGHADEIGLMVTYIDDEGFLWFASLGGYDPKILPAMRVKVFAKGGKLPGVIGALPPHLQHLASGGTEIKRYKFGEHLYIDIGAKDKQQAESLVRVGDPVVLDYGLRKLKGDLITSRGLDNKIGLWTAAQVLKRVATSKKKPAAKVIALAAVQEEIGCYGAQMAAFSSEPDVAVAVDVAQSMDHPGMEKKRWGEHRVGLGPVLGHGSANHPEVTARLEQVARRLRIDLQHEAAPRHTGTDADSIYTSRSGVPTAVLSVAQRYMHSPVETLSTADLEQAAQLLTQFCLGLKRGERFKVKV